MKLDKDYLQHFFPIYKITTIIILAVAQRALNAASSLPLFTNNSQNWVLDSLIARTARCFPPPSESDSGPPCIQLSAQT